MVDVLRDIAQDGEQESNRRQAAKDLLTFILGNRTEVKHSGGVHVEAHDPAQMEEAAARAREEADAARARLAELEAKSAQGAE